jgi:hypothetical protein
VKAEVAKAAAPPPPAPAAPAPAPAAAPAGPPPPKAPPVGQLLSPEQADALVATNNFAACRESAQKLRRAGVNMPVPLLALSALDPKLFR